MASKADRDLATIAAYSYELARQQKEWYIKNKPKVKMVHPLYDRLFIASRSAMSYVVKKSCMDEKDLAKIKKRTDEFDLFLKKFDINVSVFADFVNQIMAEKVNILFQARKGDIEKFAVMNAMLIASDELCNYFDQRVKRTKLHIDAVFLVEKWKDIEKKYV